MKVIFLDHDGVICLANNWGSRSRKRKDGVYSGRLNPEDTIRPVEYRFDNFDHKAVGVLNSILEKTDAEIVVSSDWKNFATVSEMGEYYESKGIIKKPIDFTSNILEKDYSEFPWCDKVEPEQTRSLEILEWLEKHPEVTHWVAVDDLDMSEINDWGLKNFVLTPKSMEGIKQNGIADKIISFLV